MENEGNEGNPAVEKILSRLQENRESIHINRVPASTKISFIELAEKEFCGDYGMCLKWLIDDIPNADIRMVIANLQNHEERIQKLEEIKPVEETKTSTRKMCDGTERRLP